MLKYSLKASTNPVYNKINYRDFYLAPDLSLISGVTDYYIGIKDGEEVSVSSPYFINGIRRPISLNLVRREGYVLTMEKFPILELKNVGEDREIVHYIEYNGNYYYEFSKDEFDGFMVGGFFYKRNHDNTVTLPIKNWIENGVVYIKGKKYYADMNLVPNNLYANGYETPTIKGSETNTVLDTIDSNAIKVVDYEYDKWKNVYKFVISNTERSTFIVNKAITVMHVPYVEYSGQTYYMDDVQTQYIDSDGIEYTETGYGCLINDKIYSISGISSLEDYQLMENGTTINVEGDEVTVHSDIRSEYWGFYILLYGDTDTFFINSNDTLIAENDAYYTTVDVIKDENGSKHINYCGNTYLVENKLCDFITFDGVRYEITYNDEYFKTGTITVDGNKINLLFFSDSDGLKAMLTDNTYIKDENGSVIYDLQNKSSVLSAYTVTERDGVEINGKKCPITKVFETSESAISGSDSTISVQTEREFCTIEGVEKIELSVLSTYGTNAILCVPSEFSSFDSEEQSKVEQINREIADNIDSFRFYFKETLFGEDNINPKKFAEFALTSDHPVSATELYGLTNDSFKIYQISDYLTFPIALGNKYDPTILKEDAIENAFTSEKTKESINEIVDMEKDVYYPSLKVYADSNGESFNDIDEIQFNLHFRNRDLDSWKVIQDNTEEIGDVTIHGQTYKTLYTTNSDSCNWFVTDYKKYKNLLGTGDADKLQSSSDLLTFLDFKEEDVKYRKNKIAKSFLRLSFYSTPNPNTQVLLATSTVFMNENSLYQKYLNIKINSEYMLNYNFNAESEDEAKTIFISIKQDSHLNYYLKASKPVRTVISCHLREVIHTPSEDFHDSRFDYMGTSENTKSEEIRLQINIGETESKHIKSVYGNGNQIIFVDGSNPLWDVSFPYKTSDGITYITAVTSNSTSSITEENEDLLMPYNDNALTSQLNIAPKYDSSNSSEGFYLYLFKEYSSKLREKTIYLKVEFCHAGNGLVIPFTIPMSKEKNTPLYLSDYDDVEELKDGIPLSELYNNSYIPINVKYDIKKHKYFYYLPDNYVENEKLGIDSNIMVLNLFELKIKDDSYETNS